MLDCALAAVFVYAVLRPASAGRWLATMLEAYARRRDALDRD